MGWKILRAMLLKLRGKEYLGAPTSQCVDSSFTWTNILSEGGIYKPNADFIAEVYKMEQIFYDHNGAGLKCGPK